jgi:hypothetical protein
MGKDAAGVGNKLQAMRANGATHRPILVVDGFGLSQELLPDYASQQITLGETLETELQSLECREEIHSRRPTGSKVIADSRESGTKRPNALVKPLNPQNSTVGCGNPDRRRTTDAERTDRFPHPLDGSQIAIG